jgi:hypothetical protein
MPDVGQEQHRREHQRAEHRQSLNTRVAVQNDQGSEGCRRHDA